MSMIAFTQLSLYHRKPIQLAFEYFFDGALVIWMNGASFRSVELAGVGHLNLLVSIGCSLVHILSPSHDRFHENCSVLLAICLNLYFSCSPFYWLVNTFSANDSESMSMK